MSRRPRILRQEDFGYADKEYSLVDDSLPVSRAEYDDGAALIDGRLVNISGRARPRTRFITPYNFVVAPSMAPTNKNSLDCAFRQYLNRILQGEDVLESSCDPWGTEAQLVLGRYGASASTVAYAKGQDHPDFCGGRRPANSHLVTAEDANFL